jgi:DNA-binding transcriptional LysR family regulator
MVLAASPYHPLASRNAVRPEDLAGVDFISFDEDLPIREAIDRFLEEHGVEVRQAFHFDNLQMIKEAVEQRAGVAILPARVMHSELAQGRLAAIPFENAALCRPGVSSRVAGGSGGGGGGDRVIRGGIPWP